MVRGRRRDTLPRISIRSASVRGAAYILGRNRGSQWFLRVFRSVPMSRSGFESGNRFSGVRKVFFYVRARSPEAEVLDRLSGSASRVRPICAGRSRRIH